LPNIHEHAFELKKRSFINYWT